MSEDLSATAVVVGAIVAAVPTLIGWLLIRAVRGVDRSIEALARKVDGLARQDTRTQVDMADVRARLAHVEFLVLGKAPPVAPPAVRS